MKPILAAAAALFLLTAAPLDAQPAAPFQVERSGSGRPMILISGLLSSGEVWQGTVERFHGNHDVHVLTLAGFAGVAPTEADPFLSATRDAIIRYSRDQRLERPVLVGHSLGALLAPWGVHQRGKKGDSVHRDHRIHHVRRRRGDPR